MQLSDTIHIPAANLSDICRALLLRHDMPERLVEAIASSLIQSNLVGHDSHGVIRIGPYLERYKNGEISENVDLKLVQDGQSFMIFDGGFGVGALLGPAAADAAIKRAKDTGIALVGLQRVSHLGRLGSLCEYVAERGKIVLGFVNDVGSVNVAPFGGKERRLSTNPIFFGAPFEPNTPIVLDMTTASVAEGKLKVARSRGEQVPDGWIIDQHGLPTNDPEGYYAGGALLPMGGHKGYILGVMTDILAGMLIGATGSHSRSKGYGNNVSMIVVDPQVLGTFDRFAIEMTAFIQYIKNTKTIDAGGAIFFPGEIEAITKAKRLKDGIPVSHKLLLEFSSLAGLEINAQTSHTSELLERIETALN